MSLDLEWVNIADIQPAPIRHKSLPGPLLDRIRVVYDKVGRPLFQTESTLEQFEIGFMRDMHPEREVAVWERVAQAWDRYGEKYAKGKRLRDDQKSKMIGTLVYISTGVADLKQLKQNVSTTVARGLLASWREIGGPEVPLTLVRM